MCDHYDSGLQSGVAHVHLRSHHRPREAGRASGCSPQEEERGNGTFSRQSYAPQNKLALFLQLKCCKDVPWGKRINSTWPSDLITTHSTAALLRPPARRWGTRLGSSVERQAVEKARGCIIYKWEFQEKAACLSSDSELTRVGAVEESNAAKLASHQERQAQCNHEKSECHNWMIF